MVLTRHVPAPTASSYRRTGRAQILALGPLRGLSLLRRQNFPFGTLETFSGALWAIFARLRSVPVFPVAVPFALLLAACWRCSGVCWRKRPNSCPGATEGSLNAVSLNFSLSGRRSCSGLPGEGASDDARQVAEFLRRGLSGVLPYLGGRIFLLEPRGPSPALSARFSPVRSVVSHLWRHRAAFGAGRPWRFATIRQMPEFLRWRGCVALSGFRSRISPLARPGASPRLCGRFFAASLTAFRRFRQSGGFLQASAAVCSGSGRRSDFRLSGLRIFGNPLKILFWPAVSHFFPPGRINPVMAMSPLPSSRRLRGWLLGRSLGLPELGQVALDGTVGHAEDAGNFRHGAAEFGQGRRFPPVVVAGAYGRVNVGARRPALCPRFSLAGSAARRLGGAAGFGGARAAPHCDRSTRGRILVLGLPRGPPAVWERGFPLRDLGCPLRGSAGDFSPVAGSDRRWLAFPVLPTAGWRRAAARWLFADLPHFREKLRILHRYWPFLWGCGRINPVMG